MPRMAEKFSEADLYRWMAEQPAAALAAMQVRKESGARKTALEQSTAFFLRQYDPRLMHRAFTGKITDEDRNNGGVFDVVSYIEHLVEIWTDPASKSRMAAGKELRQMQLFCAASSPEFMKHMGFMPDTSGQVAPLGSDDSFEGSLKMAKEA